ncbi:MAG: aminotransferase class I/II-fold pyridoxal phosphate-dependent enzyme [Bacillota bacterium]|nr:aminotransferase class I/II-fold pyridoxal phosphate-dependent enzyme [Bacillota bacterium]
MRKLSSMTQVEMEQLYEDLLAKYKEFQSRGLKLDMSRGKPGKEVLDHSNALFAAMDSYISETGIDTRNYGNLAGLPEARRLFSEAFLDMPVEQIIVGGNSSLTLMFDTFGRAFVRGVLPGMKPWSKLDTIKFLCPAPGYDRHFMICDYYGIEMIPVPLLEDGPDMDLVEKLAAEDPSIKGIWCVPLYSNPDGVSYSDDVVRRLAAMPTAAEDFRIFWDNAYCVHHLYGANRDHVLNIYKECEKVGNADRPYLFASTSKVTIAGGGICAMAMSPANYDWAMKNLNVQAIGFDKVNQLRHCRLLPDAEAVEKLMERHAEVLRPKFALVEEILSKELGEMEIARWTNPKGGYFISFYAPEGCAKKIVSLCKEAGVVMTGAGATYPYGKDPQDSNIRIAPTLPPAVELASAMELFCLVVKLCAVEKALGK